MKVRSLVRRARTLLTIERLQRQLVVEAAFALLRARLLLLVVPFQRISSRWGELHPTGGARGALPEVVPPALTEQAQLVQSIGWAVRTTAAVMPFNAMCLQQAMAARAMLARRGIAAVMHYGAGRDTAGRLVAHAWLDVAGAQVTGYPVAPHIAEIGIFVPRR